jgi:hypothetical protein
LEILRQISQIIGTQEDLLHAVRSIATTQTLQTTSILSPNPTTRQLPDFNDDDVNVSWNRDSANQQQNYFLSYDYFAQQVNSAVTSPATSTGVAAVQWFGLLTRDVSRDIDQEDSGSSFEGVHFEPFDNREEHTTTPLQNATKIVDGQLESEDRNDVPLREEDNWQARDSIALVGREQVLFANFIHKICSWVC